MRIENKKVVECVQYKKGSIDKFNNFLGIEPNNYKLYQGKKEDNLSQVIFNNMIINENDYVVKDSEGYHVISKNDFESTYELVEEQKINFKLKRRKNVI